MRKALIGDLCKMYVLHRVLYPQVHVNGKAIWTLRINLDSSLPHRQPA